MAAKLFSVAGLVGSHITVESHVAAESDRHTRARIGRLGRLGRVSRLDRVSRLGRVGRIVDLVMRHGGEDQYPEITGFVVRVARHSLFVPTEAVVGLDTLGRTRTGRPALRTCTVELSGFVRRDSDVLLAADVLDRQIVDTDGVHVIRSADLYLALIGGVIRLIALDTSVRTLIRRLGPRRMRIRPTPHRVIDWSHIDGSSIDGQSTNGNSTAGNSTAGNSTHRIATDGRPTNDSSTNDYSTNDHAVSDPPVSGDAVSGHVVSGDAVSRHAVGRHAVSGDAVSEHAVGSHVIGHADALKLCAPHATLTRMRAGELASRVHELSGTLS